MIEYHDVPTLPRHAFEVEDSTATPEMRYWFAAHHAQCRTLLAGDRPVAIFGVGMDPRFGKGTAMLMPADDIEKHGMALFRCAKKMIPTLDKLGELWALVDVSNMKAVRFAEMFGFRPNQIVYRRTPHGKA